MIHAGRKQFSKRRDISYKESGQSVIRLLTAFERMDNMHFKTLVMLAVNDVQRDEETDREIADKIADLSGQNENKEPNVMDRLLLERLNSNRDAFSREVSSEVENIMEI